jgi:hypothetical protein
MVSPDGIADDFWREPMTVIAKPVLRVFQFAPQVDNAVGALGRALSRVSNGGENLSDACSKLLGVRFPTADRQSHVE